MGISLSSVVLVLGLEDEVGLGVLAFALEFELGLEFGSGLSTRSSPFVGSRVGYSVGAAVALRVSAA